MRSLVWVFTALAAISPVLSATVSKSGRCGAAFGGLTCQGSTYGNCCSQYNFCGRTTDHCGTGCQKGFGTCQSSPAPSASSAPSPPSKKVSTDGTCGGKNGYTCLGSAFGNCCSKYGWCDNTPAHCGTGCNPAFGTCSGSQSSSTRSSSSAPTTLSTRTSGTSTRTSSSTTPSSTLKVSTNARCGSAYNASPRGQTCLGSGFGNCCSQYGYCGSTDAYCGKACQPGFGTCNAVSTSSSFSSMSPSTSSSISAAASSSTSTESTSTELISSTSTESTSTESASSTSTETTSSSSTISTSTEAPAPTMSCGRRGYFNGGTQIGLYQNTDFDACRELCLNNPSCQTYIVAPPGIRLFCSLSSTTVTGTTFRDDSTSSYLFYERSCSNPSSSTSSSSMLSTTTSTAESSSSSSTVPTSTSTEAPAPTLVCGDRGFITVGEMIAESNIDFDTCQSNCLDNPRCQSFGYGVQTQYSCELHSLSLTDAGFIDDSSSPLRYYDRGCLDPASSSSSSLPLITTTAVSGESSSSSAMSTSTSTESSSSLSITSSEPLPSSTTSSAITSSTEAPVPAVPAGPICGVPGTVTNGITLRFDPTTPSDICRLQCLALPYCFSYATAVRGTGCSLYMTFLNNAFTPNPTAEYRIYERGCPPAPAPTM